MSRIGSFVLVPVFAVAVVVVLFSSMTATRTARTKAPAPAAARPAAAPAPVAPAGPVAIDATSGAATVTATDFHFSADRIQARAGKVELTLRNAGKAEHELVVLRTSAEPGALKVSAAGRVSEAASVGEISETKTGVSKSTAFDLKPGRYVYVCNIPGHYTSGMRGVLVVK